MKIAAATLAVALALGGFGAPAAAQDYRANRIVKAVDQAELLAVITSLDHKAKEVGRPGQTYVAAETEDGSIYVLVGTACDADGIPGCQGIMMQMRFDLPEGTTAETLAKANLEQGALNTGADFAEKTLIFTRYQVLDNGVTMANIRANILVLLAVAADAYPIAAGEK